jgi:hypothetical protein
MGKPLIVAKSYGLPIAVAGQAVLPRSDTIDHLVSLVDPYGSAFFVVGKVG